MALLDTKHKRKSAIITASILLFLLFVIFNFGMQYIDPPEEYGLAINFGDATVGSGNPVEETKKISVPKVVEKEVVVEEVVADVADVEEAMRAAHAIGDDTIQKRSRGYVVPDSFTHGTSDQRMASFRAGLETGSINEDILNSFFSQELN